MQSAEGPVYAMPVLVRLPDGDAVGVCHQQNRRSLEQWGCGMDMPTFTSEAAALCANFDCPDYFVQQERGSMQYHMLVPASRVEEICKLVGRDHRWYLRRHLQPLQALV